MREITGLIADYLAGPEALADAIRGLDEVALRAHPAAGAWSVLEVVCHLADSEAMFAERMKRVIAEDRPALAFSDPARAVAALAYPRRNVDEEVAVVQSVRRQMGRILRAQPAEAWDRVGIHSKAGEQTLTQIVRKAVDHLEHHLSFVREKRRAIEAEAAAGPALHLKRIHHAAIIGSDYERSKRFYTEVLGLRVVQENYQAHRGSYKLDLALPDGGQIELFYLPGAPRRPNYPEAQGLRHLAFVVADVVAARDALAAAGVAVQEVRVDPYTGRRFVFFNDPDDLPLELYEEG